MHAGGPARQRHAECSAQPLDLPPLPVCICEPHARGVPPAAATHAFLTYIAWISPPLHTQCITNAQLHNHCLAMCRTMGRTLACAALGTDRRCWPWSATIHRVPRAEGMQRAAVEFLQGSISCGSAAALSRCRSRCRCRCHSPLCTAAARPARRRPLGNRRNGPVSLDRIVDAAAGPSARCEWSGTACSSPGPCYRWARGLCRLRQRICVRSARWQPATRPQEPSPARRAASPRPRRQCAPCRPVPQPRGSTPSAATLAPWRASHTCEPREDRREAVAIPGACWDAQTPPCSCASLRLPPSGRWQAVLTYPPGPALQHSEGGPSA